MHTRNNNTSLLKIPMMMSFRCSHCYKIVFKRLGLTKRYFRSPFQVKNEYVWLGARDVNHNNTYYWVTGVIFLGGRKKKSLEKVTEKVTEKKSQEKKVTGKRQGNKRLKKQHLILHT